MLQGILLISHLNLPYSSYIQIDEIDAYGSLVSSIEEATI
jgi:hypothetical protein